MKKSTETVVESCQHEHCIYRSTINGGRVPMCFYAVATGKARGCKISECDKYIDGRKIKPTMNADGIIEWVYELYE